MYSGISQLNMGSVGNESNDGRQCLQRHTAIVHIIIAAVTCTMAAFVDYGSKHVQRQLA